MSYHVLGDAIWSSGMCVEVVHCGNDIRNLNFIKCELLRVVRVGQEVQEVCNWWSVLIV